MNFIFYSNFNCLFKVFLRKVIFIKNRPSFDIWSTCLNGLVP